MPGFRRKGYGRKRFYKKRSYRRSYGKKRFYKKRYSRKYKRHYRKKGGLTVWERVNRNITTTTGLLAGTQALHNLVVQLNQLPSYAELIQLYDEYKIQKVLWRIKMKGVESSFASNLGPVRNTVPTTAIAPGLEYERWLTYIDTDGTFSFNTEEAILETRSCKTWIPANKRAHSRCFVPKVLTPAYAGLVTTRYRGESKWISTDNVDIPHYGMRAIQINPNLGLDFNTHTYIVEIWMKVSFRKPYSLKVSKFM